MNACFTLLSIDLPTDWHKPVRAAFQAASNQWLNAYTIADVEKILAESLIDAVLAPVTALGLPPLEIIPWLHSRRPDIPIIIIASQVNAHLAEDAQVIGAADFIVLSEQPEGTEIPPDVARRVPTYGQQPPSTDSITQPVQLAHKLFNHLVSLSPSVIFSCSPTPKFPYRSVSNNLETLTGYSVPTFLSNPDFWYEHIHPDDLPGVEEEAAKIFDQPMIGFDYRFLHQNGLYIWLHDEWRAVVSDNGQITEIIGSTLDITSLKKAKQELQERLKFEELIISLITRFINAPKEQIEEAIFHILSALGEYVGSDRTYFFLVNENASELTDTYNWYSNEPDQNRHVYKGLPLHSFSWSMDQLKSGQYFLIDRISEMPESAKPERERWLSQGLQTILSIPIHAHNQFIGFFGASNHSPKYTWQNLDLTPFNLVRDAFASVWARLQTEDQLRESEERFRLLAENSKDVIAMHEVYTNRILYISPSCTRLTGYQQEELIGHQPKEFVPADEWAEVKTIFAHMEKMNLDSAVMEYHFKRKNQDPIWVESTIQIIRTPSGEYNHYVSVTRDITRRKNDETALLQAQSQLTLQVSELARRANELATLSEMGNMLQVCSQLDEACNVITQFSASLFPGTSGYIATLVGKTSDLEVRQKWGHPVVIARRFRANECWGIRRGRPNLKENPAIGSNCDHFDTPLPASYLCIPITSHSRTVALLHIQAEQTGVLSESQLQLAATTAEQIGLGLTNLELRQSLMDRTRRDLLTGTLSRTILEETLEIEFARACTLIHPLSLILIDVDRFRDVNAIIGHYQADQMLISLADLIQSMLEKEDILGRFGGDEFIILLPNTQLEAAYQRAEKLRVRVHNTFKTNGPSSPRPVTISAGVACWPTHGENPTMLIRAVTLALGEAKKTRDQVALANLPSRPATYAENSTESKP